MKAFYLCPFARHLEIRLKSPTPFHLNLFFWDSENTNNVKKFPLTISNVKIHSHKFPLPRQIYSACQLYIFYFVKEPAKNLNVSSVQNNEFKIASDRNSLLSINIGKCNGGQWLFQTGHGSFSSLQIQNIVESKHA